MKTFADFKIAIPSGSAGQVYLQCPRCSHTRRKSRARCLSVNVDEGVWKCWHCEWVGSLGAGQFLKPARPVYSRPDKLLEIPLPKTMLDWFHSRGITDEVLKRNRIEPRRVYMPELEDFVEAIAFPYFRNGELINIKYRAISEKCFRLEPQCELILYGLDDIQADEPVIWFEGELDKLATEVAGFKNCLSVPNGAPPPEVTNYAARFKFLEADEAKIRSIKHHIIAVDSDAGGVHLCDELARRLGIEKCSRVRWPEGVKDANEMLVKHGALDLAWYIENAESFPIEGIHAPSDFRAEILRLYDEGRPRVYSTGYKSLDAFYQIRLGELTAVTGIPGSGKSNFLDDLYVNLAKLHGWRFGLFSPENLPISFHIAAYAEKYVGRPFFEGPHPRMSRADVDKAIDWTQEHFRWIMPANEDDWAIESIIARAEQLCLRRGIHAMVIDPWNEIESTRPAQMTETEFISHALKRIRVFARNRQIHVWIVIHPAKLPRGNDGKYPVPTLYDCAGSAHWRNKADNGICVWRELGAADRPEVDVHIQKVRFRYVGRRGVVTFRYDPICATYSEIQHSGNGLHHDEWDEVQP